MPRLIVLTRTLAFLFYSLQIGRTEAFPDAESIKIKTQSLLKIEGGRKEDWEERERNVK